MLKLNPSYIKNIVKKALEEDLKPRGDITTNLIKKKDRVVRALIIAKQDGVIAGLDFCKTAFQLIGRELKFKEKVGNNAVALLKLAIESFTPGAITPP